MITYYYSLDCAFRCELPSHLTMDQVYDKLVDDFKEKVNKLTREETIIHIDDICEE